MYKEIIHIIKELISYPNEEEWFEFKENWYQADGIGEYISSISNAAALKGKETGYLVWVTGNEPMFTVYEDRIEILSRGTLAPEQTIDGFFCRRICSS